MLLGALKAILTAVFVGFAIAQPNLRGPDATTRLLFAKWLYTTDR